MIYASVEKEDQDIIRNNGWRISCNLLKFAVITYPKTQRPDHN